MINTATKRINWRYIVDRLMQQHAPEYCNCHDCNMAHEALQATRKQGQRELRRNLEKVSREVAKWPAWKRSISIREIS